MKTLELTKENLQKSFDSFTDESLNYSLNPFKYEVDYILKPHPSIAIVVFHAPIEFQGSRDFYNMQEFFEEEIQNYGAYNCYLDMDEHENYFLIIIL